MRRQMLQAQQQTQPKPSSENQQIKAAFQLPKPDFFEGLEKEGGKSYRVVNTNNNGPAIPSVFYIPAFLSAETESLLLQEVICCLCSNAVKLEH